MLSFCFYLFSIYLSPFFLLSAVIHISISLYRYLSARRQAKLVGGEYWKHELSARKKTLIVAVLGHVAVAFVALRVMAIISYFIACK